MKLDIITPAEESSSKTFLQKFYDEGLIPAEKKNYLTDLKNSQGPWMGIQGADGKTHYILDAASQIATLGLGFNHTALFGVSHILENWTNDNTTDDFKRLEKSLHSFMKRQLQWENLNKKTHLSYTNSGAEANEMALGASYQRRFYPNAKKVLAFEGSFHGRMMVTLSATWNKSKRAPFEWPGYETVYCPFPELPQDEIKQDYSNDWSQLWANSSAKDFKLPHVTCPILKLEMSCLEEVRKQLLSGEIYAIIVEPMQCEGGDRYASDRFFAALLIMARAFHVSTIFDEVQTGFHLGRTFFWHKQFKLVDSDLQELTPDYIVCAKKAQIGMVISSHALDWKCEFQVASLHRGLIQALVLTQQKTRILEIENYVRKHLNSLVGKHTGNILRPRATGISFAFDLASTEICNTFVAKRFDRGLMFYIAGEKTLRFRLNLAWTNKEIDFLFEQLEAMAQDIFNNKNVPLPTVCEYQGSDLHTLGLWHELILELQCQTLHQKPIDFNQTAQRVQKLFASNKPSGTGLTIVDKSNFSKFRQQIIDLQKEVYEPLRQTPIESFEKAINDPHALALVIENQGKLLAIAFSSRPKLQSSESAIVLDPYYNDEQTLYMIDVTVKPQSAVKVSGKEVKYALAALALAKGIARINGKNRDHLAAKMMTINVSLGALELFYRPEHYNDNLQGRDLFYYTTNLKWNKERANLSDSINRPLGSRSLSFDYLKEQMPFALNKVCLSNFVGPRFLDNFKDIMSMAPTNLRQGYSTSGQSECVDKIVKSIWATSRKKDRLISFKGHYFGQGSNLSRSLSFEEINYFPVDRFDHPDTQNEARILKELESTLAKDQHLAIFIEPLLQRSMKSVSKNFLSQLVGLGKKHKTPVVYNETASGKFFYNDQHYFASTSEGLEPDALFCFLGGQAGIVALKKELFLDKPLMMISTWDGDEFSFAQYHKAMRDILNQKEQYLKDKENFQQALKKFLDQYQNLDIELVNGRGSIKGPLPHKLIKNLKSSQGRYLIHPSWDGMKDFCQSMV